MQGRNIINSCSAWPCTALALENLQPEPRFRSRGSRLVAVRQFFISEIRRSPVMHGRSNRWTVFGEGHCWAGAPIWRRVLISFSPENNVGCFLHGYYTINSKVTLNGTLCNFQYIYITILGFSMAGVGPSMAGASKPYVLVRARILRDIYIVLIYNYILMVSLPFSLDCFPLCLFFEPLFLRNGTHNV